MADGKITHRFLLRSTTIDTQKVNNVDNDFLAGAAEIDITPPTGLLMDGYAARVAPNSGPHDPLMAQVLVLEHGGNRAALVTLDLLAVTRTFADPLRLELAALLDTSPDAVLVAASHTHAGPVGAQDWFPVGAGTRLDDDLVALIHNRVGLAARQAIDRMQPCTLRSASGALYGLGGDRNRPDQPVDSQVTVLSFHAEDGTPRAILFHYACHPTILSANNTRYSADFPGAARERIRAAHPGATCLYLNGAAGNISTRFHRRDQSFSEVRQLGHLLGDHVMTLMDAAQPQAARLAWACEMVELSLRRFGAARVALEPTGNARLDTVRAEGVAIEADLRRTFVDRTTLPATVCGLQIDGWRLLTAPGEAFSELAQLLHADDPYALVAGYTNDYLGYFPTQAAIDAETYEALSSPYDAGAHARLHQHMASVSRRLRAMP